MANNIVLNPQRGDSITLTGVTSAYNQPNAFSSVGQTVYSTASIPANANNALYGKALTISGFVAPYTNNNGTFLVLSSTATTITTNNANGIVHAAAATAVFSTQSTPSQYASKVENMWSNQTGDNTTVNVAVGDTMVAVVIGLKQIVGFDQLHGTAPYSSTVIGPPPTYGTNPGTADNFALGQLAGLNDFNANPTISDFGGGAPVEIVASKLSGGTLTITYTNPNTPASIGATPAAYFSPAQVVTVSNTQESWLNGASITVATSTVVNDGTPQNPVFVSTITATAGFTAPVFSLSASEGALVVPGQQTTTTYLGTITGGADDAFAGYSITTAGFVNAGNNGSHTVVSSSATQITVLSSTGVAEAIGAKAFNSISEGAGAAHFIATAAAIGTAFNSVTVSISTASGPSAPAVVGNAITLNVGTDTVAAYAAAYPSATTTAGVVNFTYSGVGSTLFTTGGPFTLAGGINAATATATAYTEADDTGEVGQVGNTWLLAANSNIIDSDYTVSYPFTGPLQNGVYTPSKPGVSGGPAVPTSNLPTVFTPSTPYQSSKWSIDGYYPSIYVYTCAVTKAGSYKVNLNSMYQPGVNVPADYAQGGQPIFDGGVNFQVFNFSGAGVIEPTSGFSISTAETISNPANAPATLTTSAANGDLLLSVGLIKSGNTFAVGNTGGTPVSLTLTAVSPLVYGPAQFAPQNYGGAVYTGTITGGAANAFVGYTFTVAGFTHSQNNSPAGTQFTCTASTATTLTLSNGVAIAETHAGTAAYAQPMVQIGNGKLVGSEAHYMVEYALTAAGSAGTFNPGFQNPLGYAMLVASVAIKST
jgi:hypothetical protein